MARVRSPNYPQLDLGEAISRVAQVFAKDHKHSAPKEVVVQHLGYSGLNGASLSALSALEKYGLLDRDGEKYRVSDRSIAILHPRTPQEKAEAVQAAARSPVLFAELLEEFPDSAPSDENLRAFLIRRGFATSALGKVIDGFRKTMDLAGSSGYNSPPVPKHEPRVNPSAVVASPHTSLGRTPLSEEDKLLKRNDFKILLKLSGFEVSGEIIDQEGLQQLLNALQHLRGILPPKRETVKAEPEQQEGKDAETADGKGDSD